MLLLYSLFLAMPLLAQIGPADFTRSPLTKDPASIEAGRKLFASSCSGCHGPTGEGGRGPNLMTARQVKRFGDDVLFAAIQKGLPGTDMPPAPLPDDKVWQLVAYVRSLNAPAYDLILSGDEDRGRNIYFGKGGCNKCHALRGEGGSLGPDLTNIGGSRPLNQIREALLDPSKRIAEGYQPATVHLKSGQTITGVLRDYTNYTTAMVDNQGNLFLLKQSQVADRQILRTSPMPSYKDRLTGSEQTDLIQFLSRQSARRDEGKR
jgi:cytochrome c oxidase cbb3-type subunit III